MILKPLAGGPWHQVSWPGLTPTLLLSAADTEAPTLASAGLFNRSCGRTPSGCAMRPRRDWPLPAVLVRLGAQGEPSLAMEEADGRESLDAKGSRGIECGTG
jgi:hypothetical protein